MMIRALIVLGCLLPAIAGAEVRIDEVRTAKTAAPVVDTAYSLDGQFLFVLDQQGTVYVYGSDNGLKHRFNPGVPADRISVFGTGERIVLSDSKTSRFSHVSLSFIQEIDIQGAPFKGPENAPVTVVVFTDFECRYCADAVGLLEEIAAAYPKEVKIVFKNFPLRMHAFAKEAAAAALAAGKQDKFWPMHDLLFKHHDSLDDQRVREFAATLGLDMTAFEKDLTDPAIIRRIRKDQENGVDAGVRGTPTIFVNGAKLKKRSVRGFKDVIDAELARPGKGS